MVNLEPFSIGTLSDPEGGTGLTVLLMPEGALGAAEIRGMGPGTRELALLSPFAAPRIHALVISGGSAFGLAACDGVVRFLEEQGVGHPTPFARVPLVAGAVIYDLNIGDPRRRPGPEEGYEAARRARPEPPEEGSVGAGTGATVGKWAGLSHAMKSGQGFRMVREEDGWVGVLAVVNAVGDVLAPDGRVLAGARDERGFLQDRGEVSFRLRQNLPNTTHLVAFTTLPLSRIQTHLLARRLHLAMGRAIRPLHTRWDGDGTFVFTIRDEPMDERRFELLSEKVLRAAEDTIRRAVRFASSLHGFPALEDLRSGWLMESGTGEGR